MKPSRSWSWNLQGHDETFKVMIMKPSRSWFRIIQQSSNQIMQITGRKKVNSCTSNTTITISTIYIINTQVAIDHWQILGPWRFPGQNLLGLVVEIPRFTGFEVERQTSRWIRCLSGGFFGSPVFVGGCFVWAIFSTYGCWTKNRGKTVTPQNGWWKFHGSKPYEQMDDLGGVFPLFLDQHPYTPSENNEIALQNHCWYPSFFRKWCEKKRSSPHTAMENIKRHTYVKPPSRPVRQGLLLLKTQGLDWLGWRAVSLRNLAMQ